MQAKYVSPSAIKHSKQELKETLPKGSYTETQPITFYTEHLEKKNYYMSAGLGANPFARTCGMTQPVQKTRATSKYEGNVNFLAEKGTMNQFIYENDITKHNIHQDRKKETVHTFQELKQMLWEKANENLQNGLIGLKRMFKKMDKNFNSYLEPLEFKEAMVAFGIDLSETDVSQIMKYFDVNKDGRVSYVEFVTAITGKFPEDIAELLKQKWTQIEEKEGTKIDGKILKKYLDASHHPDYISKKKTLETVISEILNDLSEYSKKNILTLEDFIEFHRDMMVLFTSDSDLKDFIEKSWIIS